MAARLAIGTYEQLVYGAEAKLASSSDEKIRISVESLFRNEAHMGAVTCISSSGSGKYIASGSSDETIRIFDIARLKDYGTLYGHEGSINCLEFYQDSHLISGSGDVGNWEELAKLPGHKGGVTDLTIHPSGRLALSIGKDGYLKVWNLMKGVLAHKIKIRTNPSKISYSPDGKVYTITTGTEAKVYKVDGDLVSIVSTGSKIISLCYLPGEKSTGTQLSPVILALGCESGKIHIFDAHTTVRIRTLEGHEKRVRGIDLVHFQEKENPVLISGSSDGVVKFWNPVSGDPLETLDGKGRITCVVSASKSIDTLTDSKGKTKKKKRRRKATDVSNGGKENSKGNGTEPKGNSTGSRTSRKENKKTNSNRKKKNKKRKTG
ncbi:hypothetical protein AAMO2058_001145000 [Amorphochlora amoebiformis]